MNLKMRYGLPSGSYYRDVYFGYQDCGFDTESLNEALNVSVKEFYAAAIKQSSYQLSENFFCLS